MPLLRSLLQRSPALLLLAALLPGLPVRAQEARPSPESATGWTGKPLAAAKSYMVAAANSLAVEAGLEILREGGNAADAAVAVQLVLNLVEPQSSGLGGGAFALYWDAAGKALKAYDGREVAPAAARPDRFLRDGQPVPFPEAIASGLSVGVPGTPRLLEALHRAHGRLPWARLFAPAIRLAEEGFFVSPRLQRLLSRYGADAFSPPARAYFFDSTGSARPAGYRLKNPAFAATLRAIAERGADAFYSGPVAGAVAAAVTGGGGDLTPADLAAYRVKERAPVCVTYRAFRVCGPGPPSSGGIAVGQTLGILEGFDLGHTPRDAMNGKALHLIAEAEKLAFADRNYFIGDPDVVPPPDGLLSDGYLATRRALINPILAMDRPRHGTPSRSGRRTLGEDETVEAAGTSHVSIVDDAGNVLAMTTTIEAGFGSRLWAAGLLLNNELTDFSFRPADAAGRPLANAVGPGKRPRSSMAPTIVFDKDGKPWAALGAPGGSRIILYVVKTLVALIDWKLDAQAATDLMNFGSRGGPFEIEIDHPSAIWHALKVKPFGHRIRADTLNSGTHVIVLRPGGALEGGADPRREGVARGD
ncbi:MAG TPA: gamma-glutamyltransferase [Hyphomicrobiaceae bacterium]|nr:gamma-glutamyltransferase [Hyphomicrobiaceae bacterium]